jgi:hypothetical protein
MRSTLDFVSKLFGAIGPIVAVCVAVAAVVLSVGGNGISGSLAATLVTVFVVGLMLSIIGIVLRFRKGRVFREHRGKDSTVYLYLGIAMVSGVVLAYAILN